MKTSLFSMFIFIVLSLNLFGQTRYRYIAKADKTILSKFGVAVSNPISNDWQAFSLVDTSAILGLRQAGVYIEQDRQAKINIVPNDSLFKLQWGLTGNSDMWHGNFADAWAITEGSPKTRIGLLDTGSPLKDGVWTHPDLDSVRFSAVSFATESGDSDATVTDFSGHGTHTAGIMVANKNNSIGVAGIDQFCKITTYKVFSKYGNGWYSDIAQAIYRSVHDSCKILSMSFGGIFYSRLLEDAIFYAQQHGVICVVAAGNDGAEIYEYPAFFGRFSTQEDYRSGFPNVISVGAIDNFGSVASYSNYGWFVDIYAPGGSGVYPFADPSNVLSTLPTYGCMLGQADSSGYWNNGDSLIITKRIPAQIGYGYLAGTSMATPFVTGTVSLMLSANPNLSANDVRKILVSSADVMMTTNGPVAILNPGAAVRVAKNGGVISAVEKTGNVAIQFSLNQNYPNPFNPSTMISYQLPTSSHVTLKVYDMLGKEVAMLVNGQNSMGNHSVEFNANRLASGIYIYRISAGTFTQTKKMVLMK